MSEDHRSIRNSQSIASFDRTSVVNQCVEANVRTLAKPNILAGDWVRGLDTAPLVDVYAVGGEHLCIHAVAELAQHREIKDRGIPDHEIEKAFEHMKRFLNSVSGVSVAFVASRLAALGMPNDDGVSAPHSWPAAVLKLPNASCIDDLPSWSRLHLETGMVDQHDMDFGPGGFLKPGKICAVEIIW